MSNSSGPAKAPLFRTLKGAMIRKTAAEPLYCTRLGSKLRTPQESFRAVLEQLQDGMKPHARLCPPDETAD